MFEALILVEVQFRKLLSDCRVIDNHLIIDLARALFTQGSPEYEAFRSTLVRTSPRYLPQ